MWPALLASVSDADESLFESDVLVDCDPRVDEAPELLVLLPVFEACTSLNPPDPAVRVTPSISKAEPPAEAVWVVVPSGIIHAPLETCEYVMIWPSIVVVVACESINPSGPAVRVAASTVTADPPWEIVRVVEPSGTIQAPSAFCMPVKVFDPIVRTDVCMLTSPWLPAVSVTASTSTAEPPADTVYVVDESGTTQAPSWFCVACRVLLPIVMMVVWITTAPPCPWFDAPEPFPESALSPLPLEPELDPLPEPEPELEPELPDEPPLLLEPDPELPDEPEPAPPSEPCWPEDELPEAPPLLPYPALPSEPC